LVGNLVTATEEIDFMDVVMRWASVAPEVFASGIARLRGQNGTSHVSATRGRARERLGAAFSEKAQK